MQADRWSELQPLFEGALEHEGEALVAYLDEACAGRDDLRAELEALLAANHDSMAMGIEDKLIDGAVFSAASDDPSINTTIGVYRLEELIGRGGMGQVYLATRTGDQYRQNVALKLIRPGLRSENIVRRFRVERQILAQLEHPNIARLLDGGVTEDDRPYLVMEYVEGTPLIRYLEERQLAIMERLHLFRQVCEAVHFAHRNLVVHRDLKPSNILVDEAGTIKLLDFGIAKLLDPAAVGISVAITQSEVRVMTPEYAAPEQVRGEFITTATDVYALGALLYELLSGERAHQFQSRGQSEIERVVCEEEPAKPSDVVEVAQRKRQLNGDLDNIVLKALQKEPARRYTSVEALGEDIDRYVEGLPVLARPDAFTYRVRKFVRRHRVAVTMTALTVLFLMGFGITMAVLASRIANQAEVITAERDRAEEISSILVDLYKSTDPNENLVDEVSAREMLQAGQQRILELENQPETQAELYDVLLRSYINLSLYPEALEMAEAGLRVRERIYGPQHERTARGKGRLAEALQMNGRFEEARMQFKDALSILRAQPELDQAAIARTQLMLAEVLNVQAKNDEAFDTARDALSMLRATYNTDNLEVAEALVTLGDLLRKETFNDEAAEVLREGVDILRRLLPGDHPDMAYALTSFGHVLVNLNQVQKADTVLQEALSIYQKRYGTQHAEVSRTLSAMARLYGAQHNYSRMEDTYREMLTVRLKTLGENHPITGAAYWRVGQACLYQKKYAEAEQFFLKAFEIREREGPEVLVYILTDLVTLYESTGQAARANEYKSLLAGVQ